MNKLPIIERGGRGIIDFQQGSQTRSIGAIFAYVSVVTAILLFISVRLFQLTIVKGVYYKSLSEQNRVREIIIEPQRGKIIDRKGFVIAENRPPSDSTESARLVSRRLYNQPEAYSHLIGYRQLADEQDMKNDRCINKLESGDKTGKKGVEKLFECQLRGEHGKKMIEYDARHVYQNTLNVVDPIPGATIQLAIDDVLQQKAYDLIKNKKGVVVAMKPKTGEVLVLTSSPAFDPQAFEDADNKLINQYFSDNTKPMFNRATEGVYPPGSTFKMVVATAALEDKKMTPTDTVEDNGTLKAGPLIFHNWLYLERGQTDGMVDMYKAIQRSNDIYFYVVGAKVGPQRIKYWAETYGYQSKTGIGIEEVEGLIPSAFWKEEVLKEQWFLGDSYNLSIGQGYVLVTPLQVNVMTSAIANNGNLCKPQLLKDGSPYSTDPQCKKLKIDQKSLEVVKEGMRRACLDGGTGWPLFDFKVKDPSVTLKPSQATNSAALNTRPITMGCKTGTAESHAVSKIPHAWFTVYAPYEDPEIAITVLFEEGGQGSDVAAPVAKEVMKAYFERSQ